MIEYEPPITQAALMNSRPRRSRDELLESLGAAAGALGSPRDLEEVLAFAEFVRARAHGSNRSATADARQHLDLRSPETRSVARGSLRAAGCFGTSSRGERVQRPTITAAPRARS